MRSRQGNDEQQRRPPEVVSTPTSRQTTHRHSQEAGQKNNVRKKREIENMGREPTNRGQFQKQDNEAYQEQLEARAEARRLRDVVFRQGYGIHRSISSSSFSSFDFLGCGRLCCVAWWIVNAMATVVRRSPAPRH